MFKEYERARQALGEPPLWLGMLVVLSIAITAASLAGLASYLGAN